MFRLYFTTHGLFVAFKLELRVVSHYKMNCHIPEIILINCITLFNNDKQNQPVLMRQHRQALTDKVHNLLLVSLPWITFLRH